jgi:hypothetical protein
MRANINFKLNKMVILSFSKGLGYEIITGENPFSWKVLVGQEILRLP